MQTPNTDHASEDTSGTFTAPCCQRVNCRASQTSRSKRRPDAMRRDRAIFIRAQLGRICGRLRVAPNGLCYLGDSLLRQPIQRWWGESIKTHGTSLGIGLTLASTRPRDQSEGPSASQSHGVAVVLSDKNPEPAN